MANILKTLVAVLLLVGAIQPVAVSAPSKPMKELEIDLPKPNFSQGPKNIVSENLHPNSGRPRKPLMVPQGTRLVSVGAKVTASSTPLRGETKMVTDGDKEYVDESVVEFAPGVQWVQIDLSESKKLQAVVFWHFHSKPRLYRDIIVRVSNDEDFATYTELFNNDRDNSSGMGNGSDYEYIETNEGWLIDTKGVMARYVRLYSNGNTSNGMNHVIEVEVYGK